MKKVLTLSESAELELLKNVLESGGIRCVLKNVQLAQAMPLTPFNTELWVLNDDDLPQAQSLCHDWFNPKPEARGIWDCPQCGQQLGGRFDACWQCGTQRDIANKLTKEGAIL
jgi:predicted RNA-binding Zn-ribbon protein involved in translation (DUF1610 family)